MYTDTQLERQKRRQEWFYSAVIRKYKYFNGMRYLSLKVNYNKIKKEKKRKNKGDGIGEKKSLVFSIVCLVESTYS